MVLAVLGVAVVAAMSAAPASADTLSQKRAQAQAAERHLAAIQHEAEARIEAYDAIHQKFVNTRNALRLNRQSLRVARANLKAAEARLTASLTETYKTGGEDAVSYLLAARSIGELVDQMQVMQRVNGINKTLLNQVTHYKAEVSTRQARLAAQLKLVKAQQKASAAAKRQVLAALDRQKNYINNLKASIQRIITERQNAAQRAAEAAAGTVGTTSGTSRRRRRARSVARPSRSPSSTSACRTSGAARARRLRLLGPRDVRLRPARRLAPAQRVGAVRRCPHVPASDLEPGDLVFFYGLRPRRHLHRRRHDHPRAAHRDGRADSSMSGEGAIAGAARVPG